MAGLPWLIVFALLAAIGMWRGWTWVTVLSLVCVGMAGADTDPGDALYRVATGFVSGAWSAVVSALNSVAS
jgi:hypothetical protein